jgi:multidrug efflux system membrane fusion protein
VTVTEAATADVPLYLDEIGTCTAIEFVNIQPQASGQIVEIHFEDGAFLKKGDMLFTIDPRPYQAALDQAKANLAQTEATLKLARELYRHAEALFPIKATSKEDYQTKQSSVEANQALILADKAAIETAAVNLDYCSIRSPLDGRASKQQVNVGNIVTANSGQTLLTIDTLDPIYVDFTITEADLPAVQREMAQGTLQTQVRRQGDPITTFRQGNMDFLDNTVQEGTGTVALRATLANKDRYFWPGQFVRVRLVLRTLKDAVLVPSAATQISQNGPFVYVIKPDWTAEFRPITLGQSQGDMIVVREGLRAGEKVVLTGQLGVTPGQRVTVLAPPAATSAPASAAASRATTGESP